MGVWKRAGAFNWELLLCISSLIWALVAMGALLTYHSFVHAR